MKDHHELQTVEVPTNQSNDWVPDDETDWRLEVVDLSDFDDEPFVLLKFHNTSGYGTRIWIDNINMSSTLADEEVLREETIAKVYPNPNNGLFNIEIQLPEPGELSFSMTNMLGELVWSDQNLVQTEHVKSVNIENFPAGVYLLAISAKDEIVTKRIVVE